MVRADKGSSNSTNNNLLISLLGSLDNRTAIVLISVVLGIGGNQALQQLEPDLVRKDKFTSVMYEEKEKELKQYIELRMTECDRHLIKADEGWSLIYEMHESIAVMKVNIEVLNSKVDELKDRINE